MRRILRVGLAILVCVFLRIFARSDWLWTWQVCGHQLVVGGLILSTGDEIPHLLSGNTLYAVQCNQVEQKTL